MQPKGPLAPFRFQETVMPQNSVSKSNGNAAAKVIVFGYGNDDRPHAAWFPHDQADAARAAAKQLRFNVIDVPNGQAADLVGKLPAGQIHTPGPGMVPTVRSDLFEKVVVILNAHGEAGLKPGEPVVADMPTSWDAIKPGHLVLFHEGLGDGWWEAIVVNRANNKLTLRCRDYPGYATFAVSITDIALINPAAS